MSSNSRHSRDVRLDLFVYSYTSNNTPDAKFQSPLTLFIKINPYYSISITDTHTKKLFYKAGINYRL